MNKLSTSRARAGTTALGLACALTLALAVPTIVPTAASAEEPTTVDILRDFEDNTNGAGYQQYGAAGAGTQAVSTIGDGTGYSAEPNQYALSYGFNTLADPWYGGILWESPAGTTWDWSAYDGVQMWVYGDGSAHSFQIELQDKAAGVANPPELFDIDVPVGAASWRLVRVPFEDITFATDYQNTGGVANSTLDLSAISALALPANGDAVIKVDDIALYAGGSVPPSVGIVPGGNPLEGATATVEVRLNKAATTAVTVDYATADDTALAGTDYTAASGTLAFAPGETVKTVTIATIDNDVVDGNRAFRLALSNVSGATLGTASVLVTVRDNDSVPADKLTLIHEVSEDFEAELVYTPTDVANPAPLGWTGVFGGGNVPTVDRVADDTVPGAESGNHVLDVTLDQASWTALIYRFSADGTTWTTQDWAQNYSVGFWMKGTNSGARLFLDVLDNRNAGSTVDDAERYTHTFADDFTGWKFIELPLADFIRKDATPGAPNDGFTLSDIHGFAIGNEPGTGSIDLRFDDFVVIAFQEKVEDFEQPLPAGVGVPPIGWIVASGGADPSYTTVVDDTHPLALAGNQVLEVGVTDAPWGALVRSFGDDGVWTSQDWSSFTGLGFWFNGQATGNTYEFDVLDNRNFGSTTDDAERFSAAFVDDTAGWTFVEIPFSAFHRKDVGNGAPNDGFGRTEVHGFGLVHVAAEPTTIRVDDITLLGSAERALLSVAFNGQQFSVDEGDDAQVAVRLNRAPDTEVSVGYETVAGTSDTTSRFAVAGRDFTATSGTLTFPAGERDAVITVPTTADGKPESAESFRLRLVDLGDDVQLNPAQATVTIVDQDAADPLMVADFEYGAGAVRALGDSALTVREIAAADADAYPGQYAYDHVLDVTGTGDVVGLAREYVVPEDWSAGEGLGYWYRGTGNGETVTTTLRDAADTGFGGDEWQLAWSDEFELPAGTPPNPANWTSEINGHGWGNQELQYYTDSTDNAAHDGEGNLVITLREIEDQEAFKAEQRALGNPETCHYGDCRYTSARLNSFGKVEFQYGRVEARSQLPDGKKGLWPAVWALGTSFFEGTDWPYSGEIDIMEYVGKLPNEIFGTVHGPGYSGGNAIHAIHDFTDVLAPGDSLGNKWMRFAIEWEPTEIRWYVALDSGPDVEDGEWIQFHSVTPADAEARGGQWVFDDPEFLIMNFAIGGNFGEEPVPDIDYPQEFTLDYIRILQPTVTGDTYEHSFVDDVDGWRFVQLPFAAFEASDVQIEGAPGDGLDTDRIAAFQVEAAGGGTVSFDRIQVLPEVTVTGPQFADVQPGHAFYDAIRWLADEGLSTGTEIDGVHWFYPSQAMSRQAMAAFMFRYLGDPAWAPADGVQTFSDVPSSHAFYREIEWMADQDLTSGYDDGTFRPAAGTSRQAMAVFLHRLAGEPAADAPAFSDVPADHPFATAIGWLEESGIARGYSDGRFAPAAPTTRQAMAAYLFRYDQL